MQKHVKQQIQALKKTFGIFYPKDSHILVKCCIDTLNNGGQIIATAVGKNIHICSKFIDTLNSLGIDSHFLNTNSAVHGDLGVIKKNDLVIIVTKSGETAETIYLAKILKKRATNNWLLTCNKHGTTSRYVKNIITLQIDNEGDPWDLIPNNSTLVFLIFLQALAMELADKLNVPISIFKNNHPGGGIGKALKNER